jgi:hypothetical protein
MTKFVSNAIVNDQKFNGDEPGDKRMKDHSNLNKYQIMHLEGKFNVYEPIPQDNGEPLPPLAVQWKEDAKRRFGKHEHPRNR